MKQQAETVPVAETETVPTMPGLPLSGATETVAERVKVDGHDYVHVAACWCQPVTHTLFGVALDDEVTCDCF